MPQFVVMGVSGSGKTSVAKLLADNFGGNFLDADDFHSIANKAKMAQGLPLEDEDRQQWLTALNTALKKLSTSAAPTFLACSALRQVYRERLSQGLPGLRYIHLKGSPEVIRRRLESRRGHFFSPALLESQFSTLEEPADALTVSTEQPLKDVVAEIAIKI